MVTRLHNLKGALRKVQTTRVTPFFPNRATSQHCLPRNDRLLETIRRVPQIKFALVDAVPDIREEMDLIGHLKIHRRRYFLLLVLCFIHETSYFEAG